MSKELEEIEKLCKHLICHNPQDKLTTEPLRMVLNLVESLVKPVQYVVQIVKKDVDGLYMSKLNGVIIYHSFQLEEVRPQSIFRLNKMSEAFSLPPITIEQITFVEV